MKRVAFYVLFFSFSILSFSQTTSHIQVVAESGISIFLDGIFQGTTKSSLGGLIISDLSPGTYTIKAVKDDFQPQEGKITLRTGEVKEYRVRPFKPNISIEQKGNADSQTISLKTGSFKVQSLPISIKISSQTMGVESQKNQDEWLAKKIPEGIYKVTFEWNGKRITEEIEIVEDKMTHVFVDMIKGKVEFRKRPGAYGGLSVTSIPSGKVFLDNLSLGTSPLEDDNIKAGNHTLLLEFTLAEWKYLNENVNYSEFIEILNDKTTSIHYDLFKDKKFGEIFVTSSKNRTPFALYNKNSSTSYGTEHTTFSKKALVGSYDLKLEDAAGRYTFDVVDGKKTHIILDPLIPRLDRRPIASVKGYESFENFYSSRYKPIDEYRKKTRVYWDIDYGALLVPENLTFWGGFWNIVGKAGLITGIIMSMQEDAEGEYMYEYLAMGVGINLVARWGLAPLDSYKRRVKDPTKVAKNKEWEAHYRKAYQLEYTNWEKELDKINSEIREENNEIREVNKNKKVVVIDYE